MQSEFLGNQPNQVNSQNQDKSKWQKKASFTKHSPIQISKMIQKCKWQRKPSNNQWNLKKVLIIL